MAEGTGGTVLTWSVANWITVSIMAVVTFSLWGLAQKYYQSKQASS